MESPDNLSPDKTPAASSNLKRNLIIGGIILAVVVFQYFSWRAAHQKRDGQNTESKEPLLHRDEPVKEQIFQEDYEEKVREMLDSGKTIMEISRETGIRRDAIRKIKKEKDEEEE